MSEISRSALFGKLNKIAYRAIESATVFCKMRGNPYVELEHWLHQILQLQDSDIHRIIRHFELNPSVLAKDMLEALDQLPRGSTSISDFSAHVEDAVERGWVYGSLLFGDSQIRTGHLLVGILRTRALMHNLHNISQEFSKVRYDSLSEQFSDITRGSPEAGENATDGASDKAGAQGPAKASQIGGREALQRYTVDMTAMAQIGKMDPIVGRDQEIRQVIDILMRRRQNNPILTGEAGVGKTAIVEGFAQRIAAGEVPPALQNVELRCLDVGMLQAGASMKGEFEERLKQVINEVQASEKPIILFIDEAHTLIGAGGAAGTGDAANLLKPALARGTLRTIAATTWAEYKKHIEKDPALTRRFQVVQVFEPDEAKALLMMRGMVSAMEQHHNVHVLDAALEAAVKLSHRYIPARQLPDKAVSLLDTACARVAISQAAVPPAVEDCRRRIQSYNTELDIIAREEAAGEDIAERAAQVRLQLEHEQARLNEIDARWQKEKQLVQEILALRAERRNSMIDDEDSQAPAGSTKREQAEPTDPRETLEALRKYQAMLRDIQGEEPLMLLTVDAQAVASVVQDWTGIPVGRMVKDEIATVQNLADILSRRIIGQRHALEMIAKRVQTSRAGLDNPAKPIGVFLLAGTSGVGKTETALALAEVLFGGDQNVITINMSEYQEAHTVSGLKGAPPGYVGYGEGGVLTEAVRRKPYSVVLLDEVEKAHPDVHELFFQVFDKGWMEDGEGRQIDFRNTLIILTTNVGTEMISAVCKDPDLMPDADALAGTLRAPLLEVFPPALLGRLVTIPYFPLSDEMIAAITRLQLDRIRNRLQASHNIPLTYDEAVVSLIAERCTEVESGGRMVDAILTNTVLPAISQVFLARMADNNLPDRVHLTVEDGEFAYGYD